MPTFTFDVPIEDERVHRRIAKDLSLWLRGRGVDVNHVLTRFRLLRRAYSGPFPMTTFALVHGVVSRERDLEFCHDLAARITTILQPEVPPQYVFVRLEPIDERLHFTGTRALETGATR